MTEKLEESIPKNIASDNTRRYKRNSLGLAGILLATSFMEKAIFQFTLFSVKPGENLFLFGFILLGYFFSYFLVNLWNDYKTVQTKIFSLVVNPTHPKTKSLKLNVYVPLAFFPKFYQKAFKAEFIFKEETIPVDEEEEEIIAGAKYPTTVKILYPEFYYRIALKKIGENNLRDYKYIPIRVDHFENLKRKLNYFLNFEIIFPFLIIITAFSYSFYKFLLIFPISFEKEVPDFSSFPYF